MMEDPRDLNSKNSTKNKNAVGKQKTKLRVAAERNSRGGADETEGGEDGGEGELEESLKGADGGE